MSETVSAREAVEASLVQRAMSEPGFIERITLDADGVVKPILADVLGDDGDLDLDDVTCTVHVETDRNLHFVLTLSEPPELDEVSGFAMDMSRIGNIGLSGGLRVSRVPMRGPSTMGASDTYTQITPCTTSGVCACQSQEDPCS